MKTGILTFYYAHNYGAVLQAYALKTYLSQLGNEVYMIPYRNKGIQNRYPRKLKPLIAKKDLLYPSRWAKCIEEMRKTYNSRKDWAVQYEKFEDFISEQLLADQIPDWKSLVLDLDVIFFGSDQIWERRIVGESDFIYAGDFLTRAKKIGYAASCFSEETVFSEQMICHLKKFSMISVREHKLAQKLSGILNMPVEVVCDPVFLLEASDYDRLEVAEMTCHGYILFYFVSEDPELQMICEHLRGRGKRVFEIHYYKMKRPTVRDYLCNVGPGEFLNMIKRAEAIFTNSFHGTAFSIIFEKNFYVKSTNTRLINILEIMGLEERLVTSYQEWEYRFEKYPGIDYKKIKEKKELYINHSKEYIERALGMALEEESC